MENIKYNIFDFFVYLIPGTVLLLFISLANSCSSCSNIPGAFKDIFEGMNAYGAAVLIAIAYCVGFIGNILSSYLLKITEKLKPLPKPKHSQLPTSEKLAIIREKSKENFKYVEQWNALKKLSATLALIILAISIMSKWVFDDFTFIHLGLGVFFSVILVLQAMKYDRWALIDLDNAVKTLTP